MLEYVVKLGWRCEFLFGSLVDATRFAELAALSQLKSEEDPDPIEILIRKVKEEEEDDETN